MSVPVIFACPEPHKSSGSGGLLDLEDLGITVPDRPEWCVDAPAHPDTAADTPVLRHRSKTQMLEPAEGGGNGTRTGRTTITVQTEQHYDRSRPATVNLAIDNNGDQSYSTLSSNEAKVISDQLRTAAEQAEAA